MCIILLAYKAHPRYKLVLAANRDEFYSRPSAVAGFWAVTPGTPEVLAGRDLERGGTWMGVTRNGRIAAVTNYRDAAVAQNGESSRGHLVSDFLSSATTPSEYLSQLTATGGDYNGFNLFVGDASELCYYSNRTTGVRSLSPGIYGLSNHLLDTPWPKVEKGKAAFAKLIESPAPVEPEKVFSILADSELADDSRLPQTGVGLEIERALSPLFISTPIYGTRSSTLLLIERDGKITFTERTYQPETKQATDIVFEFQSGEDEVS